jgi:hypothetical protein
VRRKKFVLAAVIGVFALLILCAWKNPFAWLRYHGDGELSDSGFFSYPPRYQIAFADVPLDKPGEHQFRVWGLPIERMQLVLAPKGKQLREWAEPPAHELRDLTIEAILKDDNGSVACHLIGHPGTSTPYEGIWNLVLSEGTSNVESDCGYTHVNLHQGYTLVIRVVAAGADYHDTSVTPLLRGGGLDLP